jgi:DNA-binding response OmpR family regulator
MARILLLEDEVTFRSVLTAALTRKGHTVMEAADGRTGLALFKTHGADLVITDVMMPDQDGLEVIMAIRGGKNPTPILAMTGHPGETELYLRLAKSLGAQRILAKPFRMEELFGAIDELVSGTTPDS